MRKFLLIAGSLLISASMLMANGQQQEADDGMQEFSIFLGYEKDNYPREGTIFGNWLEEQTNVRIDWDILVGDLEQRVGIMVASGDYPDAIAARNATQMMHDAGAFIPLNDLLEEHGQDILALWGDYVDLIRQEDGEIYWLPQTMPWGDEVRRTQEAHAFYVQKAVLEHFDYPEPTTVEETMEMLVEYAEEFPEIDGNQTFAFAALNDGWRNYTLMNVPSIFSGHPNDGKANVDWVDGKWQASLIGFDEEAYKIYKIYNDVYLQGQFDPESFIMNYDQYQAKLTTGSILGFYDQWWNFTQPQDILKNEGEDRWYVPLPVVMDGYPEAYESPLEPQATEGIGISVDAEDPVALIKYFNFLAKESTILMRQWGREGEDYLVDEDGMYYRTEEMMERFEDTEWRNTVYGADYWVNFLNPNEANLFPDGKNSVGPGNQPAVYQMSIRDTEREVLDAYDLGTFHEFFNTPDPRRGLYFPAWSIEYPTGSDEAVTEQRIGDLRERYIPRLISAPEGTYDEVWDNFMAAFNEIPSEDVDAMIGYLQDEIDRRVEINGGYF